MHTTHAYHACIPRMHATHTYHTRMHTTHAHHACICHACMHRAFVYMHAMHACIRPHMLHTHGQRCLCSVTLTYSILSLSSVQLNKWPTIIALQWDISKTELFRARLKTAHWQNPPECSIRLESSIREWTDCTRSGSREWSYLLYSPNHWCGNVSYSQLQCVSKPEMIRGWRVGRTRESGRVGRTHAHIRSGWIGSFLEEQFGFQRFVFLLNIILNSMKSRIGSILFRENYGLGHEWGSADGYVHATSHILCCSDRLYRMLRPPEVVLCSLSDSQKI